MKKLINNTLRFVGIYIICGLTFYIIFIWRFAELTSDFIPNLVHTLLYWPFMVLMFVAVKLGFIQMARPW